MNRPQAEINTNPFPGLRPFTESETHLFFGRERQVDTMVDMLDDGRFLAVVGTSGSGKSSLVNCGLVPALHRGLMTGAGNAWRVARMRPGIDPIGNLAEALCRDRVLFDKISQGGPPLHQIVETNLRMSNLGLVDVVEQARLDSGTSLLVVVDQFEELFRYSKLAADGKLSRTEVNPDAIGFVNLLLQAIAQSDQPIYVVLTMRSDFLGDCAKFHGLPEAMNASQFLVPRLTREERRAAIVGPAQVAGARIESVLVTRLVNDASDNPDQLSVLQHALNRTWAYWQNQCAAAGSIGLKHYKAVGTISDALNDHAERAFSELGDALDKRICERVFKALTDKATDARGIRRPTRFDALIEIADTTEADLTRVLQVFRKPSRSFLMPPEGDTLEDRTVIDISHESLMRGWRRLKGWSEAEAHSAQLYQRVAVSAELYDRGEAALLRDPDLQIAVNWRERQKPVEAWAQQYGGHFEQTMAFLDESIAQRQKETEDQRAERRRKSRRKAYAAGAAGLIALAGMVTFVVWTEKVTAQKVSEASRALRETEFGDPVRGALISLQALQGTGSFHSGAFPALENALWQSHASIHLQKVLKDHDREIRAVAFSSDGKKLATGSYDGRALIYDTETWQPLRDITELTGNDAKWSRVLGVAFSPDGTQLATGSWGHEFQDPSQGSGKTRRVGRVRLWDTSSGALEAEFKPDPSAETAHDGPVRNVRFNREGTRLISSSYDDTARIWDVATGALEHTLRGHKVRLGDQDFGVDVYDAAFHPHDRGLAATVGNDGKLRVWNLNNDSLHHTEFGGHEHRVGSVAFSPDGSRIVTASDDDTVRVWDYRNKRPDGRPLAAHSADTWRAVYDDKGDYLFTASWDRSVGIWHGETHSLLARLRGHEGPVRTVAYDANTGRLASGATDRTARIWSLDADDITLKLQPHDTAVTAVRSNPANPDEFALAGEDGTIQLRSLDDPDRLQVLKDEDQNCDVYNWKSQCAVSGLAMSNDGGMLAALYADKTLRFWNTSTGTLIDGPIKGKRGKFRSITGMPDRMMVAVGSNLGGVVIHRMQDGEQIGKEINVLGLYNDLPGTDDFNFGAIEALDYNEDRQLLAAGMKNGIAVVIDLATGQITGEPIRIEKGPITSVRFDKSGSRLFVASWHWVIEAWDFEAGRRIAEMKGHQGTIRDMALIDGGNRLVTGSADETVRIWNPVTGQEIVSFPGHSGTVRSVAVVPGAETKLLSASEDKTLLARRVFRNLDELKQQVCKRLRSKNLVDGGYLDADASAGKPVSLDELCPAADGTS